MRAASVVMVFTGRPQKKLSDAIVLIGCVGTLRFVISSIEHAQNAAAQGLRFKNGVGKP